MKDPFPTYRIDHFLNEPANPTESEITRFEHIPALNVEDPHRHLFYEILWTDGGLSRQAIDGVAYEVRGGTLFFISPGQLHFFEEYEQLQGGSVLFMQRCVNQRAGAGAGPARRYVVVYKQLQAPPDRHYLENLSAADYAARLAITAHHLNVVCKAVTGGRMASAVVRARAVLETKRQLVGGRAPAPGGRGGHSGGRRRWRPAAAA